MHTAITSAREFRGGRFDLVTVPLRVEHEHSDDTYRPLVLEERGYEVYCNTSSQDEHGVITMPSAIGRSIGTMYPSNSMFQ